MSEKYSTKKVLANGQRFELEIVGHVVSDGGQIELGDLGDAQLSVQARCGGGLYVVHAVKINGTVRGYFVGVDALEDWIITDMDGVDRPWPPKKIVLETPPKKTLTRKRAAA